MTYTQILENYIYNLKRSIRSNRGYILETKKRIRETRKRIKKIKEVNKQ